MEEQIHVVDPPRWRFGKVSPDEKQHGVTQRDQFSNEQITPTDALVREALQNSVDARRPGCQARVSFRISTVGSASADYLESALRPLAPHLEAAGWRMPTLDERGRMRVLLIEDFGTTGLSGSTTSRDGGNFDSFWRRIGLSAKTGQKGGRWGLGKTVYASASRAGAFFGLSISEGEGAQPALMGECTLDPHSIGDDQYRAYGYFAHHGTGHMPNPIRNRHTVSEFASLVGLKRAHEPGLSLVIPHIRKASPADILRAVVESYYFPIILGRLTVDVNHETVNAHTLSTIARALGTSDVPFGFLEEISRRRAEPPDTEGEPPIGPDDPTDGYFGSDVLDRLRRRYDAGRLIQVRLPLALIHRTKTQQLSWIDLFLQRASDDLRSYAVFVRGDMVVPGERRWAPGVGYAALVADEDDIVEFLGDAENPAHTEWNERAEKLRSNWNGHAYALRAVRRSLRNLHRLLVAEDRTPDHTTLTPFFPMPGAPEPAPSNGPSRPPTTPGTTRTGGPPPRIQGKPPPWIIQARIGGFVVTPNSRARQLSYPFGVLIRIAYDVPRGDPFRRYSPFDFDLTTSHKVKQDHSGAKVVSARPGSIEVVLRRPEFRVSLYGFDTARDLVVRVEPSA